MNTSWSPNANGSVSALAVSSGTFYVGGNFTHMGGEPQSYFAQFDRGSPGLADFNGDGMTDLVWRNRSSGENVIWLMDGVTPISDAWLQKIPALWEIVGPK